MNNNLHLATMARHQWIVLLFVGCAIASPFPQPLDDEDWARLLRRPQLLDDPDTNTGDDPIVEINEASDVESQLFEGDIKDPPEVESTNDASKRATAHRNIEILWHPRIVHYVIDASLAAVEDKINQAIAKFHEKSCLRWVKRTSLNEYYVQFVKLSGCWSYIGYTNNARGYQEISLGTGCDQVGIIMHEMMHALGFWHEQSRPDRGFEIEIMWENIRAGKEGNFKKYLTADTQKTSYDMGSIMQYNNKAFSKNGKMTIRSITNPTLTFGQRTDFSTNDIVALNNLYSCSVNNGGWSMWTDFPPRCDANCKKRRGRFCTNAVNRAACNAAITDGKEYQTVTCTNKECYAPINGHWGRWSAWSACSKTCGDGTFTRTRVCDDPAPTNNGTNCSGSSSMTGACKVKECGQGPGDCGFDDESKPICDWEQVADDTKTKYKEFVRGSSTPSSSTGPQSGDHTTGNGKFIYGEASDCLNNAGKFVRFQSVEFQATGAGGRCIRLWTLLYGKMVGEFNVYLKGSQETKLYGFAGHEGAGDAGDGSWKEKKIHFTHTSGSYRIVLEMKCGADYRGDVAIDDIKFTDGACA